MDNNALIVAEKLDVTVVFSDKGMAKLLDEIKTKVISHIPNTETEQGRKDIISLAYKITRSKTLIDDLGKGVVSDWKKKAKLIDEHRKTARDFLDDLKNIARQPLTDWEAEQSRIKEEEAAAEKEKIQARVNELFKVDVVLPFMDVALMTYDEYMDKLNDATGKYVEKQIQLEEERKAKEIETVRLATERAEIEKIRAEQVAMAREQAKREEALKAQERALDDAKRKEIERQEQIAWQTREAEKLRIQVEKDTAEKVLREAREKEEKEEAEKAAKRRLLEIAPDKDKLIAFANQLQDLTDGNLTLNLKSNESKKIYGDTILAIVQVEEHLRKKIEEL